MKAYNLKNIRDTPEGDFFSVIDVDLEREAFEAKINQLEAELAEANATAKMRGRKIRSLIDEMRAAGLDA